MADLFFKTIDEEENPIRIILPKKLEINKKYFIRGGYSFDKVLESDGEEKKLVFFFEEEEIEEDMFFLTYQGIINEMEVFKSSDGRVLPLAYPFIRFSS